MVRTVMRESFRALDKRVRELSDKMTCAECRATSDPELSEIPIVACPKVGASFIPSPTNATESDFCKASSTVNLSCGSCSA